MALLFALLPPAILLIYVNFYIDRKDIEVKFNIIKSFLLGIAIVLPIAILETKSMSLGLETTTIGMVISQFIVVGTIEEIGKLLIAYYILKLNPFIKSPINIIVIIASASMGLALIENVIYIIDGGMNLALLRAFSSIPMHISTAIVIGFFGVNEELKGDQYGWIKGYIIAVLMHGFYNSFVIITDGSLFFAGSFIIALLYFHISNIILYKIKTFDTELKRIDNLTYFLRRKVEDNKTSI